MGIAYSQAGGTHQVTRDGAMTKRMQPGFGARSALLSIAMSRAGIRGAQNIFEGADGLGRTYLRSTLDSAALRDHGMTRIRYGSHDGTIEDVKAYGSTQCDAYCVGSQLDNEAHNITYKR